MARAAVLAIKVVTDASQSARELDKVAGKTGSTGKRMAAAGAAAGAGLGLLAVGAFKAAQAAASDARGQALLANALQKSAGATDAQVSATEDWISAQGKALGVTDDQLRPALATLARATGDVGKAQEAASIAMDVSAATGKDLNSVSAALAKGYAGNTGALGKLVPGLDKGVLATKDMNKITAELARTTGGSAAKAANTAAGKQERMTLALDETYESIGGALLPVLSVLSGVMMTVAQWAQANSTLFVALAGVLATIAAIVVVVSTATKLYTTYQAAAALVTMAMTTSLWAMAAAMLANPITWIVLGIVALIAALVLAYKKSATFRAIVQGALAAVMNTARTVARVVGAVLSNVWRVIMVVARPIIWAISTYIKIWLTVAQTVAHVLTVVLTAAFRGIKTVAGPILDGLAKAWGFVMRAIQPVVTIIERLIDLIGKIKIPKIPKIPGLGKAAPTYTPAPGVASARGVSAAPRVPASSGRNVVVNINQPLDPHGTARVVQRLVHGADVRTGRPRFA